METPPNILGRSAERDVEMKTCGKLCQMLRGSKESDIEMKR